MVFEGFRQQTLDIDVVIEVAAEEHADLIQAIRELKEGLDVNVEEASPADFIPLPSGYQHRHQFIDRFGGLEVFHFDLYSVALSKIERGQTKDFEDVLSLLKARRINWGRLEGYFHEILPLVGTRSLRQDPQEFERSFHALQRMRHDSAPPV